MDLYNNAVGQSIGAELSDASDELIADAIWVELLNGNLKRLFPINYDDPDFRNSGGIDSTTALITIMYPESCN